MLSLSNVWDLSRLSFLYSVISLVTFLCSFFRASRHAWRFLLRLKRRLLNKFSRSLFTFSFFSESGCAQPFVPFDDAKVMTFPCSKQAFPPFSFKILLFFDAYQEWCVRTQSFFLSYFQVIHYFKYGSYKNSKEASRFQRQKLKDNTLVKWL